MIKSYKNILNFIANEHPSIDSIFTSFSGKNITVGVLDSGIDSTHPFLKDSVIETIEFNEVDEKIIIKKIPPGENDHGGHGTACAGIIKKIAPDVKFIDLKVLGQNIKGSFRVLYEGIKYAVDNNIKLLNLSLGTVKQQFILPLLDIAQKAYEKKIILVAANDNNKRVMYPAVFPGGVIGVDIGETKSFNDFLKTSSSLIDFAGFGAYVETCGLNHTMVKQYGTSFATPHIAGIIVLLLEKFPELSVIDAHFLLSYYSKSISYRRGYKHE